MVAMTPAGRPPKAPEDRAEPITVRLTPTDRERLKAIMDDRGCGITEAVQIALFHGAMVVWQANGELDRRDRAAKKAIKRVERGPHK